MKIIRLALFGLMALLLSGQGTVQTLADIAGDGNAHQISTTGAARWIQFVAPTANVSVVRVGDSNTSTTRGTPIAAGAGFFMPPVGVQPAYQLNQIYYLIAVGDKLSITWRQ